MAAKAKKLGINWRSKNPLISSTELVELPPGFVNICPILQEQTILSIPNGTAEEFISNIRPHLENELVRTHLMINIMWLGGTFANRYVFREMGKKLVFLQEDGIDTGLALVINPKHSAIHLSFEDRKALISAGASPFATLGIGYTSLTTEYMYLNHFNLAERMNYWLDLGVDPSSASKHGTVLHMAIANETHSDKGAYASAFLVIDLFKIRNFNWNATDAQQKNVLILAAKMRAYPVVEHLCRLQEAGLINIDLGAHDEHGLTAAHYSCILGDVRSLNALKNAQAPMQNSQWKITLEACTYAHSDDIKDVLRSVSINPLRDSNALRDYFVGIDFTPIMIADPKTGKPFNVPSTKSMIEMVAPLTTQRIMQMHYPNANVRQYDLAFNQRQVEGVDGTGLTGKTLLSACLNGQEQVRSILTAIRKPAPGNTP